MGEHSSHSLLPLFPDRHEVAPGRYLTKCFEHEDDRPSLWLTKNKHGWRYHCYACGADGDAIDVLMRRDEMTFQLAYKALAGDERPPIAFYRATWKWLAICDSCLTEEVEIRDVEHLAELGETWEISEDGRGCVGPVCLRIRGLAA